MGMDNAVYLWTIYFNPLDHPGKYVGRRWKLDVPEPDLVVCSDVESVREWIRRQLPRFSGLGVRFDREPDDDPVIVETWI